MLPRSLLYMILAYTAPCMGLVTPTNTASEFQKVQVGSPFTISWSGATGDVTIALLLASGTTVVTIGSALTGTSYVWTPPALSTTDTYSLQFVDSTLVTSKSVSFNFSEDSVEAARDASSSQLPSTTRSTSLTSIRSQTSSTSSVSRSTMSSILSFSTVDSQIPTSSSTASSAPTVTPSTQERGLSAGAKAGISIGVIIGVLLIICLVVLAFWIGRRSARNSQMNDHRDTNDMEGGGSGRGWYGWEKPKHDPGSTGSKNNLLKRHGDGRSSRMGTMMTDGRSSRMDTATFTDGRSSRLDTMTMTDGRDSRMDTITPTPMSPLAMSPVDGRTSRVSVLSDGRTSRIGRFEFEDSTDVRGFSGGIRIVEMEDFKI
ncbi:hypothetical protein DL95DRAFT_448959 [Leptodontidium sp. 2 PMI_412]|nr:hypothetical protein BKA61DRAFT_596285 [Leptodontidium sp. MPI-SDFR-AT-0119]KAH9210199.1 hypothetical protein DL95DRAFT_448959 [Leptodontidium sp. 2 PMI_412]